MRDGPRSGANWWSVGNWGLRWKVTALVALPLTAALALGSLRITSETHDAQTYNSYAEDVHALPPVLLMADASAVVGGAMALGVPPTEQDLKAARDAVAKVEEIGAGGKLKRADNALHRLLDIVRGTVNSANAPTMPPPQTFFEGAKQMTDLVWQIVNLTLENLPDRDADEQAAILSDQIRAKFSLTEEVFAAGAVAMSPRISTSEYQLTGELKSAVATAQTTPLQIATEVERSLVLSLAGHRTIDPVKIKALRDGISHRQALAKEFGTGKSAPMVFMNNLRESLYQSVGSYNGIAGDAQKTLNIAVQNQYNRNRNAAQRDSILLAGGLVLELLLAALAARSLLVPLRRLRSSALSLADRDLPAEIERIREGANVDDVMPLPMPVHTTEEVGQLARAIDDVHEQALRLAGEQAQLRRQVSDMFETLARRSKSLVDHQLGVIEAMEYEEKDPKLLEGLFRLDHLAARMRRNSDNLLILAGTKARRTKAAPVEIGDVLRAAISEVEEYQRVKLGATPRGSLTEPAASDIAHLFAELLDNALRASPPETDVKFTFAQANDQGLLIEVADRGIGIPAADLAAINRRLEAGAEIGTETARHMGLFVVSRLAERHGLTVRMRPTFDIARDPGITVTVHVPRNLIVGGSVLASGKPVVTRPSALETTGSGQIKAITRTPGGNMMLTVDDGAERPDLPQRRPGGSILGDPPQRPERPVLPQRGELPQRSELPQRGEAPPRGELPQRAPGRRSDVPGLPERPERSQRGDTTGERPAIGLSPAGLPQRRPQQHRPPEPSLAPGDPLLDSDHGESDFGREPSRPSLLESTVSMPRPRPGEDDEVDHDADWNGTQTDLPAVTPEEDPDYDAEIAARVQAEAAEDARLAWERAGSGTFGDLGEPVPRHGRTADTVKTAAFFQSRIKPPSAEDTSGIPIFAEMMSGWLSDWQEGMPRPAFETIADEGWSAAQRVAEAASTVNNSGAVTESGLPQRRPGEWLIPGAVGSSPEPISPPVFANATLGGDDSAAGLPERSETAPELPRRGAARMDVPAPAEDEAQLRRDPETVRASLARHQTGVRNGRAMTTMKATRDEGDQ